jgi:hypothetical protein
MRLWSTAGLSEAYGHRVRRSTPGGHSQARRARMVRTLKQPADVPPGRSITEEP